MDAGSSSDQQDLPHRVCLDSCDGFAEHAIRQSGSVSDDAVGLSGGMFGHDLPVPSGSAYEHRGIRFLCGQADGVVLFVRAVVTRFFRSCETTWGGVPLRVVWIGDSSVAVGGKVEVKVKLELGSAREKRLVS